MKSTKVPNGLSAARTRAIRDLLAGSSVVALAAFAPGVAAAQVVAEPGVPSSAQGPVTSLGEVVVTAQKRSERLLTVPAPVTALTSGELTRTQSVRLEDYAKLAPGLGLISQREGQTQIVLRGITTGASTPNTTVATYVDDAPFGSSTVFASGNQLTPDFDPADVQRIEVLRGPQGTLYGASALGGLVKYVTAEPDLASYAGRAEVDGSSMSHGGDGWGVRALFNAPLIKDVLALRVSAFDRHDPGFIDNSLLGQSKINATNVYGGRVALLWKPITPLSIRLTAQWQNLHSGGTSEEDVDAATLRPLYGEYQQQRYVAEPLDVRYRLYSAVLNYDLGGADFVSATSYATLRSHLTNDLTATYQPLLGAILGIPDIGISFDIPVSENKFTQEFRLASSGDRRLDWQGGFFLTHESSTHGQRFDPFFTTTGAPIPINLLSGALISRYTEYAGFGDLTYHFTPQFDVQAGVRYSENHQHYSQPQSGALIGPASTLVAESSDQSTTFLITPRFRFNANNMIYGRVASGYRPGGPNPLTPAQEAGGVPGSFGPDTLINYEIGYKASLLDSRLTVDLSAFHIDWNDVQIQTVFNGFDATGNGGGARSDGFEASAVVRPVTGLSLNGSLAYTNARLTQDSPAVNGKSGDELPNVPKWSAYVGADYDFPIAAGWDGFVGGGLRYLGDRKSGFVGSAPATYQRPTIPSYTTVDLRAGLSHDQWSLTVYAKNIANSRGINNLRSHAFDGYSSPVAASMIEPRTVGVSLSAQF